MRHTIRHVALPAFILLLCIHFAQQDSVQFNHLTIEDGLSQSTVEAILQNSKGYMLFDTQDGLNHYNGYDIIFYKSNIYNSTSISDNDMNIMI